jgi:putative phage-type endonuclease
MSIETIEITSEAQWLRERTKDLTSTDIAALFDLSPYKTSFELYHEKQSGQVPPFRDNERMKWGRRFEAPIAKGVAEDEGWEIAKLDIYMRDTAARLGSSFDFLITSSSDGPGILEIKNVDGIQYRNKWTDLEAPEHIELQIQHQMLVSGYRWTALVAMVNGNSPKIIYREFDPDIAEQIRARAKAFWQMVETGVAPAADYSRDADLLTRIHANANRGEIFDASGDNEIASMVFEYHQAGRSIDDLEARRKEIKARILDKIGTAERVTGPWGTISCGVTKDTLPTLITPDMVGQSVGGRKGFRNFKITIAKEAK